MEEIVMSLDEVALSINYRICLQHNIASVLHEGTVKEFMDKAIDVRKKKDENGPNDYIGKQKQKGANRFCSAQDRIAKGNER